MRRVAHATTLTGDPLVMGFLLQNCQELLDSNNSEEQKQFLAQDSAVAGTVDRLNGVIITSVVCQYTVPKTRCDMILI